MYESPIIVNVTDPIFESMNKARDEYVIRACQRIGVDINQEELIKALQYDRDQYEKGYADGLAYKRPVETKADLIRSMSDEELDKFLGEVQWDVANYCGGVTQKQEYPVPEQRGAWLDWLRQEEEHGCAD